MKETVLDLRDAADWSGIGALASGLYICKVPATDLRNIHELESAGFRFSELQLTAVIPLSETPAPMIRRDERLTLRQVRSERDLVAVQNLLSGVFSNDRFSLDPAFGTEFSAKRYAMFLRDSFLADDQFILAVYDGSRVIGFRSYRANSLHEAGLLLGGVAAALKMLGFGHQATLCFLDYLRAQGFKRAVTKISSSNLAVINSEISALGFRVRAAEVVMRKIVD